MNQASITVDIKGQIINLKEILAQMQKEVDKLDIGSSLGKNLRKEVTAVQKVLENLSKDSNIRLTSEGSIDNLTNKLGNVISCIEEIGSGMQKVTLNDINTEELDKALKQIKDEWQQAKDMFAEKINLGLTDEISKTPKLKKYLEDLGQDIKNLNAVDVENVLRENMEKTGEAAKEAALELGRVQEEYKKVKAEATAMTAQGSFYNRLQSGLENLKGQNFTPENILDTEKLKSKIEEWEKQIDSLTEYTDSQKNLFKEKIRKYFDPTTMGDITKADDFVPLVVKFKKDFAEAFSDAGGEDISDFYKYVFKTGGTLLGFDKKEAEKLFHLDPQAIEEGKRILSETLQQFKPEELGKERNTIQSLLDENEIEKAAEKTIKLLKAKYGEVSEEAQKLQQQVSDLGIQQRTATLKSNNASRRENTAINRYNEFLDKIKKVQEENGELKKRIEELEKRLEEGKEGLVNNIRGAGLKGREKSNNELLNATHNASLYKTELEQVQAKEKLIGKIEGVVQRWFSIYAAVRMADNAIKSVISTIKELDKTITEIAIVTNMSQDELWGQMKSYTDMARQYAASISGVYKVSQLYYQQGLQTADVMALTEQTLKMARISGLDYTAATNYMTNAIRSFKMEMTDAQRVVDVYSAIAASSATSTTELASAMSKTASSAAAVGSSFENTTAMMAVMIEATRESAENIGSALKSIISRYGEMKSDPTKLIDSEGEEMSLNKVDKALQSVGISIQDTNHQFRDFDDVITELAGKWNTIDTNTQRYIATIMAGNRQQSRFLALVSSGERLAELSEQAANSEDTAQLQMLKTMDSIEAKSQQLKTSLQSLYTDSGIQNLFKGFLDIGNQIVKTFDQMPTVFNLPIPAILKIGTTFASLANVVTTVFGIIKVKTQAQINALTAQEKNSAQQREIIYTEETLTRLKLKAQELNEINNLERQGTKLTEEQERRRTEILREAEKERKNIRNGNLEGITKKSAGLSLGLNLAGVALSTISGSISDKTRGGQIAKGSLGILGSTASMAGMGAMMGHPLIGAGLGAIMGIIENINFIVESYEAKVQRLKEDAQEKTNTFLKSKNETKELNTSIQNLKKLESARYDSLEAEEQYYEAANKLGNEFPYLISSVDEAGNTIIDLTAAENQLTNSRKQAIEAAKAAAIANYNAIKNDENNAHEQTEVKHNINTAALKQTLTHVLYQSEGNLHLEPFKQTLDINEASDTDIFIAYSKALAAVDEGRDFFESFTQELQTILNITDEYFNIDDVKQAFEDTPEFSDTLDLLSPLGNLLRELENSDNVDFNNFKKESIYEPLISGLINFEDFLADETNINNLKSYLKKDNISEIGRTFATIMLSMVDEYSKDTQEELRAQTLTKAAMKSGIAQVTGAFLTGSDSDFIKNFTGSTELLNNLLLQEANKEGVNYTDYIKNQLTVDLNQFLEDYELFWDSLSPFKQDQVNQLLANASKYSESSFTTALGKIIGEGTKFGEDIINSLFKDVYDFDKFSEAIKDRNYKRTKEGKTALEVDFEALEDLGSSQFKGLLNIYDTILNYLDSNQISTEQAYDFINEYKDILTKITSEDLQLSPQIKAQASDLVSNWDNFSISGLLELSEQLSELGIDDNGILDQVKDLYKNIPINLETELNTFSNKVVSNIENFEKAISNAAKGMDLKTATEMAQKIGKDLSDFDFKDGLYFFKDFNAIKEAYFSETKEWEDRVKKQAEEDKNKFNDNRDLLFTSWGDLESQFSFEELNGGNLSIEDLQSKLESVKEVLKDNGFSATEIIQYYKAFQQRAENETNDFVDWVALNIDKQLANNLDEIKNYTKEKTARTAISVGDIEGFVDAISSEESLDFMKASTTEILKDLISKEDWGILGIFYPEYLKDFIKNYKDINKKLYDSILSGSKGGEIIEANEFNQAELAILEQDEIIKKIGGQGAQAVYETIKLSNKELEKLEEKIKKDGITEQEKEQLKKIHDLKFEDNIYEGLSGVIDNFDKFSYEAGQKLANSLGTSIEVLINTGIINVDEITGDLSISYEQMRNYLASNMHNMTIKQYNELRAKLEAKANKENDEQIFNDIVQNRSKLSEDNIAALGTILNKGYVAVTKMLHQNADGTYTLDLATIQKLINGGQVKVNEELNQLIANEIDTIISSLTGLGDLQNKGTTSIEDMQKRVAAINQQSGQNFSMQDLFVYDEQLNGFVYSTQGLQVQAASLAAQLEILKSDTERNADEIWAVEQSMRNIAVQMANNIDFSSVLDLSIGDPARDIKFDELKQAIEDYNTVLAEIGETSGLNTTNLISALRFGGENAVRAAEAIAKAQGKTLSASDVEAAYRNHVSNFVNAIDTVIAQPGEIVDYITAQIISANDGKVNELGDTGQYVVETAANLYEAYNDLFRRMAATGEATLADLNKVAGLALDNKDGQQIAIDALGDAANLTYSRLGEIFTSVNKLMTKELVQDWTDKGLIKALGGNKIQITDFAKFADLMGFDTGSPEYVSAFKSYNDSLIEMNRKAEKNILEEAQSLGNMKAGDWIDLTQLGNILENIIVDSITELTDNGVKTIDISVLDQLNTKLNQYGAYLENGILKTVDGANIPAIIQEVANSVQQYGNLSEAELAQLADTLKEVLKSYADLISGAIEGSLSNEGAQQLSQWSESLGLGKLNFQETTQGLKLATDQAYRLYQEISKIDALQGRVVFDNLAESLRADKGGDFSSATATMAAVARIQKEINSNNLEIQSIYASVSGNVERLSQQDKNRLAVLERQSASLKDQLGTYNQLAQEMAWSNMDNPESYDFMNRDLPNVAQGPINYWNSVGEAFGAMREAGNTGKMEIQDFYNIVTEMSNLAAATGTSIEFMGQSLNGDLTNAANLIEAGFSSLSNVDGKGIKVDMGKLAANLQTGATDMGKGFDTAIKEMAESQVHMLDGMIKLMETIVAMEQLGQVDVDNNGILSVGEIFKDDGSFTEMFNQVRDYLANSEELKPLLNNLKVNGIELSKLLSQDQEAWRDAGISEQQYAQVMTAFYQAASSDNYDLDNLISSVMNVLSGSGQVYSYYDEETGVETVINAVSGRTYTVNWDDEKDKQRIYDAFITAGYKEVPTDEEIRAILDKGHAGELTGEALIAYEITYEIIKEYTVKDDEGNETTVWKDSYGNTYNSKEEAVIGNAFAKQQGEAGEKEIIEYQGKIAEQSQTFTLESGLTYKLRITADGEEHYSTTTDDGYVATGNTYQEMIDDLLNHVSQITYEGKNFDELSESKQIQLKRKLGITVTPEVIFTNREGNEVDPANDPAIRTELVEFFNHSDEEIKSKIKELEEESGNYEITLYDGSKIQVKADNPEQALQKVQDALDPLTTSISTAITRAFTVTNKEDGNAVQEAISTAIKTALGIGQQTGENSKGNGIPISGVTLSPQGLTIDLSNAGEPTLKGAEEEIQDISIAEVTLKPTTVNVDVTEFDAESVAQTIADAIQTALDGKPITPNITAGTSRDGDFSGGSIDTSSITSAFETAIGEIVTKVGDISKEVSNIDTDKVKAIQDEQSKIKTTNVENIKEEESNIGSDNIKNVKEYANTIDPAGAKAAHDAINSISFKSPSSMSTKMSVSLSSAKGNVALAGGRNTLMGELGPELVVSRGRYFLVGQSGAEFVNLDKDAIVFNHLQTQRLMQQGAINNRGKAITNERNAVSFATGNAAEGGIFNKLINFVNNVKPQKVKEVKIQPSGWMMDWINGTADAYSYSTSKQSFAKGSGFAMASASDALATLKQLRSMWQSLLNASLRDLGAMGGSGGGGGGGGGSDEATRAVLANVERWYNWLKKIEATQNKINILTKQYTLLEKTNATEATKYKNLTERYNSLKDNYDTRKDLIKSQTKYRNKLLAQVDEGKGQYGLLSAFYGVNKETNQLTLKNDKDFEDFIGKKQAKKLKKKGIKISRNEYYTEEQAEKYNKEHEKEIKAGEEKAVKAGDIIKGLPKKKDTIKAVSGLELVDKLQKRDNNGKLIYDADEQLKIITDLYGEEITKYLEKDEAGNKFKNAEEKMEYFFAQIDSGKNEIETLTNSIQEQTEAALDDAIAMEEINDQIYELYAPVAGVTEGLEKWYNELKRIEGITRTLNKLGKDLDILEKDRIANGGKIYENIKNQIQTNKDKIAANNDLNNKQKNDLDNRLKNGDLQYLSKFIDIDENGIATFKTNSVKAKDVKYTQSSNLKYNDKGYLVDTEGRYIDEKGVVHESNGKKAKEGVTFGEQDVVNPDKKGTFSFKNKDINQVIKELTAQKANGETAYTSYEQFQILEPILGDLMQYDEQGNKIYKDRGSITKDEMQKAVEVAIKRLQNGVDEINDNNSDRFDREIANKDAEINILDLEQKLIDNQISLENQILEAIIQERQTIIDNSQKERDAYAKAADRMINGLNEQLKKEQEMYSKNTNQNDVDKLQRQLDILKRSGGSMGEIQRIEEELASKRKDMYFDEQQSQIDAIKEASDKQLEKMDQEIEILTETLVYQKEHGLLWDKVNTIINTWSPEKIAEYVTNNTPQFSEMGLKEQKKSLQTIIEQAQINAAKQIDDKKAEDTEPTGGAANNNGPKVEDNEGKDKESIRKQSLKQIAKNTHETNVKNIKKDIKKEKEAEKKRLEKIINTDNSYKNFNKREDLKKKLKEGSISQSEYNHKIEELRQKEDQEELDKRNAQEKLNNLDEIYDTKKRERIAKEGDRYFNELKTIDSSDINVLLDEAKKKHTKNLTSIENNINNEKNDATSSSYNRLDDILSQINNIDAELSELKVKYHSKQIKKEDYKNQKTSLEEKRTTLLHEQTIINEKLKTLPEDYQHKLEEQQAEEEKKYKQAIKDIKAGKILAYSKGGLVDYTGLAMVHGSKTKPESVFNAEQTKMLKDILFNFADITTRLNSTVFNPNSEAINGYNNNYNENNSSIQINGLSMNLNVPSISNDYDARRAGQIAFEEMVRIARKNGNNLVSRR